MGGGKEEKPFTIVDKRKREENAAADSAKAAQTPQPGAEAEETAHPEPGEPAAPPINFSTFVISLSSSALYHMGGFQDPYSGKTSMNLELAKQTIDIIAMLEEKTRGNLDQDEQKLISNTLYELRMMYVELAKA